jgi:hypothetical protein
MESFDMMEGKLELIVGSGWMSRYEASRLAPGAVVRTTRIAGTGYELRFNGERLAEASGAVIGPEGSARLCAQVESLDRRPGSDPQAARGTDMTELLPFTLLLGSAKAKIAELSGLGRTSIIDLGIEAGQIQDAELRLADFPAARGTVSVVGENMAFTVSECLSRFSGDAPFRTTGSLIDASRSPEKVKDYNFRMPDCFTKAQLGALASLHQDFLSSWGVLAAQERGSFPSGLKLEFIDQLNFTEFAESLKEGELIVAAPCSPSVRPRLQESERPAKDFLDVSGKPGFPPETAEACARAMQLRPLGGAVLASGDILSRERDLVFAALRDAWKSYGALSPFPAAEFRRAKEKPALALSAYADEYEMVALAGFSQGGSVLINIAYPLRSIEAALKALSA